MRRTVDTHVPRDAQAGQPAPMFTRRWRRKPLGALMVGLLLLFAPALALFNVSAATSFASPLFQTQWQQGEAVTPNFWGPLPLARDGQQEPYVEAPGGSRLVQYFDKARMELTNPATSVVTNGLLATELITGRLQLGDATFQQLTPAAVPVAGDPDNVGPTYAAISANAPTLLANATSTPGASVNRSLGATGTLGTYTGASAGDPQAAVATYDAETQHNVPKAFSDYRTKAGLLTIGFAISEAFWSNVKVAGVQKDVFVQAFQRRILTYTPSNPDAFKVEFGNIGQHYYTWRYISNQGGGTGTPTTTATTAPTTAPTTTPVAPVLTQPSVTNVTMSKATVSYTTDIAVCGTVELRIKGDTSFITNIDSITCTPGMSVTTTLTGLDPKTTYEIRGAARVGSGPIGYSAIATFTTLTAQPTAESYDGNWVNDVTPTVGQFSRIVLTVTGNNVAAHIFDKGTPTDTDIGTTMGTFTADPLTFALNGHAYTVSFTDDTRLHLKVVVMIAANGMPEGTFTFHRQFILPPIVVLPGGGVLKP